jgi:serine/threonine protein kinase/Tfp pilus assembly protein PilF
MAPARESTCVNLEALVEAYEQAQVAGESPDLADFLPPADHALYGAVLVELVRLDMEYGWAQNRLPDLEAYRPRFPELFHNPEMLREIAFEAYRLRLQAGQLPSIGEYQRAYGVNVADRPAGVLPVLDHQASLAAPVLRQPEPERVSLSNDRGSSAMVTVARAYRDFRLNPAAGTPGNLELLSAAFRVDPIVAELFQEMHRSDPEAAARLAEVVIAMPQAGCDFLGFRLVRELGRGAFGRVFLAQQGDLANRSVALKVSTNLFNESQTLAQLQHTNIVPIYSIHRVGPIQAVCMPYLGSTTLATVCKALQGEAPLPASGQYLVRTLLGWKSTFGPKSPSASLVEPTDTAIEPAASGQPSESLSSLKTLGQMTYVQAVLWLGARLAEGLAHAHERGILHLDLKPANVLLADDGQPILLDFNLAQDTKLRSTPAGAHVGGTLPYMPPEQIEVFQSGASASGRPLDGRTDLYSLGTLLYQLLCGRLPFEILCGPTTEVLPRLLEQRCNCPPRLRPWNSALSFAAEAIIRRCLEPDPNRRYPSAAALAEDLDRHLADLPLRHIPEPSLRERAHKWVRRHPRLTSVTTVGTVAIVLILILGSALVGLWRQQEAVEARTALDQFREEKLATDFCLNTREPDQTHLDEGLRRGQLALARYRVVEDERWTDTTLVRSLPLAEQERLREEVADLLWTLVRATSLLGSRAPEPRRLEFLASALTLSRRAETCYPAGEAPKALWVQRADLADLLGQREEAQSLRHKAEAVPAQTARDHFLLALELRDRGQTLQAVPLFRSAIGELEEALLRSPWDLWGWYLRGNCHDLLRQDQEALTCYTVCVALNPGCYEAYFNRALVYYRGRRWQEACTDLGRAIDLRPELPEAYFQRALAEKERGDHGAAERDLTRALALGLPETRIYFLRSEVRAHLGDQEGARCDREEGLGRQPSDEHSWLERGIARLGKKDSSGALDDFEEALKVNPRYLPAWQNKGHVLANLGHNEQALQAIEQAVSLYPDFVPARLGRGVLLARLGKRDEAHRDARAALDRDANPGTLYQVANIYALTSRQNPSDSLEAFPLLKRALAGGFGLDIIDQDTDMDPIRTQAAFRRIVTAARDLQGGSR